MRIKNFIYGMQYGSARQAIQQAGQEVRDKTNRAANMPVRELTNTPISGDDLKFKKGY